MNVTRNISLLVKSIRNLTPRSPLHKVSNERTYASVASVSRKYTQDDVNQFKSTFPEIGNDLTNMVRKYDDTFVPKWFEKSLSYNVNAGKLNRGQLTVIAYKLLVDESQLTSENIKLAQYVGWMSEIFEGTLFLVDDLIDGSETRRNKPCWHTLPEIKMNCINDLIMLENALFVGLKKIIGDKDYYPRIYRMFSEAMFITSMGQTMDHIMSMENVRNQTMERFGSIIQYTTCHSAFYMPVALALEMCGNKDLWIYIEAKRVLSNIGLFFQSRNDYLDCFGDFAETGKEGTDIRENKLSWMAVKAMERADSRQREIMETCYGQNDPKKISQVIALYKEMGIDKLFLEYEKESYEQINTMINDMNYDNVKPLLHMIWDVIYYKKSW